MKIINWLKRKICKRKANNRSTKIDIKLLHRVRRSIENAFNNDILVAADFAKMCGITYISEDENSVYIELSRPGIFIGRKGETISKIKDFLEKDIQLIESNIDWVIPCSYDY